MARKPTGGKPGRPRKTAQAAVVAALLASGAASTVAEAVEGLDIAPSTAARHLAASGVPVPPRAPAKAPARPVAPMAAASTPPVAPPPAPAPVVAPVAPSAAEEPAPAAPPAPPAIVPGTPLERLRAYAAHDTQALLVLERLAAPAPLSTDPLVNVQRLLSSLELDYLEALPNRRGAVAEKMISALKELRQYFPPAKPAPPVDAVLEAVRAQDFGAIAKIEEHLARAEQATAADLR